MADVENKKAKRQARRLPAESLRPPVRGRGASTPSEGSGAARFSDPAFEPVARGQGAIEPGASGPAVKALQRALWDLGYPTRRTGFSGVFDSDTARALRQFQTDHELLATGGLERASLERLAAEAPPPGTKAVRYPEYDSMFENGILDVTLATGFLETNSWPRMSTETSQGLQRLGFKKIAEDKARAQLPNLAPGGRYFARAFRVEGRDVQAVVRFIDPSSFDAVEQFRRGFAESDLVLYNGHGRAGAGPDFDEEEKISGNFVIGESHNPVLRHRLSTRANDVAALTMTSRYQLMFFRACETKSYIEPLRAHAAGKSERNLDVLASVGPLFVEGGAGDVVAVLEAVMACRSVNEMVDRLAPAAPSSKKAAPEFDGEKFVWDGFGANRWGRT